MRLDDEERSDLKALVDRHGIKAVAAAAGISRMTLATAIAGLDVRGGSVLSLRMYLGQLPPCSGKT